MSFAADAQSAISSHLSYFGRGDVEFRSNDEQSFLPIVLAVVHKEETKQKKAANGWQKVLTREVFVENADVSGVTTSVFVRPDFSPIYRPDGSSNYLSESTTTKVLNLRSSFRIDSQIYTVDAIERRTNNRLCVHLIRNLPMEVARPGYRMR